MPIYQIDIPDYFFILPFENNFTGQIACFQFKLVLRNGKNKTKGLQKQLFLTYAFILCFYMFQTKIIYLDALTCVQLLQNFTKEMKFKGYLRYKTITSQNVSSEAQVKNFLSRRKVMFCPQNIQALVFLTIP